jgi:hypothetical protein
MPVAVSASDAGSGVAAAFTWEITRVPVTGCTPPLPRSALPLKLNVPSTNVGFASVPENNTGPPNVVPPPEAPPALRKETGPLSVLPSNVTDPVTVKEVPGMNDVGVGDASNVVVTGPVICGLVKVNRSIVAAWAGIALSATEMANAESDRIESTGVLLSELQVENAAGRHRLHTRQLRVLMRSNAVR